MTYEHPRSGTSLRDLSRIGVLGSDLSWDICPRSLWFLRENPLCHPVTRFLMSLALRTVSPIDTYTVLKTHLDIVLLIKEEGADSCSGPLASRDDEGTLLRGWAK